jgi:hypothetical protein
MASPVPALLALRLAAELILEVSPLLSAVGVTTALPIAVGWVTEASDINATFPVLTGESVNRAFAAAEPYREDAVFWTPIAIVPVNGDLVSTGEAIALPRPLSWAIADRPAPIMKPAVPGESVSTGEASAHPVVVDESELLVASQ